MGKFRKEKRALRVRQKMVAKPSIRGYNQMRVVLDELNEMEDRILSGEMRDIRNSKEKDD